MPKRHPEVEQAISDAAERLLSGQPMRSVTGDLSVAQLAVEAEVPRAWLYREYMDLKEDFERRAKGPRDTPPPGSAREEHLLTQIDALRARISDLEADIRSHSETTSRWKDAAHAAFRIVNVLEKEAHLAQVDHDALQKANRRLRAELEGRTSDSSGADRPEFRVIPGRSNEPDAD
ncbi:MAG TPA: hypothetical protein VNS81_08220 [Nocardioides sp.]|nr:hypothetical protein [Nocardioides sp.]